jgi:hypothetical protein
MKSLAKQVLQVRREQIDIKFIFDHLRNYGICAAIFYAGNHIATNGAQISHSPLIASAAAIIFQFLAFVLFNLNFTHGLFAIRALSDKPINQWLFSIFTVLSFYMLSELIGVKI